MKENKESTSFTLSPVIVKRLRAYAEKRACSASVLAEVAIRAYLRGRKV